jgi:hypothetical protein
VCLCVYVCAYSVHIYVNVHTHNIWTRVFVPKYTDQYTHVNSNKVSIGTRVHPDRPESSVSALKYMYIYTYMHTYIYICMYACMYTYIDTHSQTYIPHMYICTPDLEECIPRAHTHTHTRTHTHTHTCMYTHAHTHAVHTHIHT